jgi:two-component system CheB/CheR fusion protein
MENTLLEQNALFLDSLLDKVYRGCGYDFRDYKRSTVIRRLERRLHATGTRTYLEYMEFLDGYPEEYQELVDDLTINVSGFFRSEYSFQQMAKLVLPELVSSKESKGNREIKFWSTACARGEEPYSLAILLNQFLGQKRPDFDVSIYATDISQKALSGAQAGVYSIKETEGLSPVVLQKYFVEHSQGYALKADIRRTVSFSYFDLTSTAHPPFVNVDCIFCCNVLIYFQKRLQERVLNMLFNSLAAPGYLVLGEVETPTESLCDKLECLNSKARIYKKVNIFKK